MYKGINSLTPIIASVFLGITLSACGSGSESNKSDDKNDPDPPTSRNLNDIALRSIITLNNLTGNALKNRAISHIESAKAQLGMRLFFSKSLSGDRDVACVTCHHPVFGGGDNLSLPVGVGSQHPNLLGKGRTHSHAAIHYDGGPTVPRNAPTTFNIAAWDKVLFHDGRIESLGKTANAGGDDGLGIRTPVVAFNVADPMAGANLTIAQTRFPLVAAGEMRGFTINTTDKQLVRNYLASRLGGFAAGAGKLTNTDYWLQQFRTAFMKPTASAEEIITEQNIAILLSEYERSQAFTHSLWRQYVEGANQAISEDAKQGALLFFRTQAQGGANCASCHQGDLFSDESFHNIAMPQIGRGKNNGATLTSDFGRFRETKDENDKYAFRTPSLLNIEVTGPWSHTGSYTSLKAVVQHHLNPQTAVNNYDINQLKQVGIQNLDKIQINTQAALDKLVLDRSLGKDVIQDITLSNQQVNYLVIFLKTLTDSCVKDRACLAKWIPPLNEDPNGDQLDAVDATATAL
jgi:cytochrome c peroxidase